MTVTEIALVHLTAGTSIDDIDIRSKLSHAKNIMQNYTGYQFYYMRQIEDPSYLYIIGEWESLDQHMNHFIPGDENQAVLASLKDEIVVDWLLHIDASHDNLPVPKTIKEKEKCHRGDLMWSIERHFVKAGQKDGFQQAFDDNSWHLQSFVTEGMIGGGWRVDQEDNEEEWVLLCPWQKVEQHSKFAELDGFARYDQIQQHLRGAEVKHAKLLEI
ncbi:hypothetical protein BKA66DRAFT_460423 [Pyrenochaeta sp. MPI-SDFR-AT-0127]|nr:hypothetical protein BKA66DRAFT_460423 [Pyrenochaeta sp. MPI-SDFR-AT-0127]